MAKEALDAWRAKLRKIYGIYTGVFVLFVVSLWILESMGLDPKFIGYAFLFGTIGVYAAIGIISEHL